MVAEVALLLVLHLVAIFHVRWAHPAAAAALLVLVQVDALFHTACAGPRRGRCRLVELIKVRGGVFAFLREPFLQH